MDCHCLLLVGMKFDTEPAVCRTGPGPVSRKSRNFSGAFWVTQFSLYLQSQDVSKPETL